MEESAGKLKALGDPTRLRVAVLLAARGEVCVCHMAEALGEEQFKISRHLAVMRAHGLVEVRREGVWKHYRLARATTPFDAATVRLLRACLKQNSAFQADLACLDEVQRRDGIAVCPGRRGAIRRKASRGEKDAKARPNA